LPQNTHDEAGDLLVRRLGSHSALAEEGKGYARPYIIDLETGKLTCRVFNQIPGDVNPASLKGTGFGVGGVFFGREVAEPILGALVEMGYEIVRKYE
jgi:hypothetical protein